MRSGWLITLCGFVSSCFWTGERCDSAAVELGEAQGSFQPSGAPTDALMARNVTVTDDEVSIRYLADDGSEITVVYVIEERVDL